MTQTKLLRNLAEQIKDSLIHGIGLDQPLTAAQLLDAIETVASCTELDDRPDCPVCGSGCEWTGGYAIEWRCVNCDIFVDDDEVR
jgi:tRNA(Ile2) C34 agmatinyltransferase TiaS